MTLKTGEILQSSYNAQLSREQEQIKVTDTLRILIKEILAELELSEVVNEQQLNFLLVSLLRSFYLEGWKMIEQSDDEYPEFVSFITKHLLVLLDL